MRSRFAVAAAMAAVMAVGGASAQEARPPGPGAPGQPGHMHHGHDGHLMMCHHVPEGGGAAAPRTMGPGMMGPGAMGPGLMRGITDLPADPKQAARVLRLRADMLKAIGEVLARHAAEFEKAQ